MINKCRRTCKSGADHPPKGSIRSRPKLDQSPPSPGQPPSLLPAFDDDHPLFQFYRRICPPQDAIEDSLLRQLAIDSWRVRFSRWALDTLDAFHAGKVPENELAGPPAILGLPPRPGAYLRIIYNLAGCEEPREVLLCWEAANKRGQRRALEALRDHRRFQNGPPLDFPPEQVILIENEPIPQSLALPVESGEPGR